MKTNDESRMKESYKLFDDWNDF